MSEIISSGMTLNQGRISLNQFLTGSTFALSATTNQSILNINSNTVINPIVNWGLGFGKGNNLISGAYSTVLNGSGGTASNNFSLIGNGRTNTVSAAYATVLNGVNNSATASSSFVGAGGGNVASYSNAVVINGVGNKSTARFSFVGNGISSYATGVYSFIGSGQNVRTNGYCSFIGNGYSSIINGSTAYFATILNGKGNAIDTGAQLRCSTILNGYSNHVKSQFGLASGRNNVVLYDYSMAFGVGASPRAASRMALAAGAGNTIEFDFSAGNGYFDGSADVGNADYAERFMWADGNPNNDNRYGFAVSLVDNGEIEIGNMNIIGIISSTPGVVGDSAEFGWKNKYKTDEWGIPQQEEFSRYIIKSDYSKSEKLKTIWVDKEGNQYLSEPRNSIIKKDTILVDKVVFTEEDENNKQTIKINLFSDDYDSKKEYIPRSKRPEYGVVGLLGKLRVRTAENINSKFVDFNSNGEAINGTKYRVIEKIKDFDGDYGIVKIFFK